MPAFTPFAWRNKAESETTPLSKQELQAAETALAKWVEEGGALVSVTPTFGKGFGDKGGSYLARIGPLVFCGINYTNLAQPKWSAGVTYKKGDLVRLTELPTNGTTICPLFESLIEPNKGNEPNINSSTAQWARTEGNLIDSLPVGFRPVAGAVGTQDVGERIWLHAQAIGLDPHGNFIETVEPERVPIALVYLGT